jgi:predicted ATPase/DNA-binding SARP family transcriptional activator
MTIVRYAILGPVELHDGDRRLAVEGRRQRGLLVLLLLHANHAAMTEELIEAVWPDLPADGARKRLRMAIARLRETLAISAGTAEPALRTISGGYVLDVQEGDLDAAVFEARVAEGRDALRRGDAARATQMLAEALALWRGPALADVAYEDWAQPEIRRLEELQLTAYEARIDADLQLGRHADLAGELEALAGRHPTRERLVEQLMLALYRCGRQTEALDAYRRTRESLLAQLGLEPGPGLQALQAEVLRQAPSLELGAQAAAPGSVNARAPAATGLPAATPGLPARRFDVLGRDGDARAVIDMLSREDVRLVTVIGPGGVGKTTLAIEVAHRLATEFADGATFVNLAAVTDPDAVADTVLHALGCPPEPGTTAKDSLCRLASRCEQLLVLDNLEQLLAAAPLLAELLESAPRLKLLATSRAALDLRAEHRYRLGPLALPDSSHPSTVTAAPATALFIARASARDPAFRLTTENAKALAEVCARVDGLPLAIELAAARAGTQSPQEIASRLDSVLTDLGSAARDAPDRHRTMRATLDWSYGLLDESQRSVFARLSVFAGGCTFEAAQHVTSATLEVLESLVDHSMLTRGSSPDGTTRLGMLEPVREYAAEQLAARADAGATADRHSRYYVELAETVAPRLLAAHQLAWQRRLDAEADNLQEALQREHRAGNAEGVVRLATALREWWRRGRASSGRAWAERGLAASTDLPPTLRADALTTICLLSAQQGDICHALECGRQAVELYDDTADRRGSVIALVGIAVCHLLLGDQQAARTAADDAVRSARDLGAWPLGYALIAQAVTAPDPVSAKPIAERAVRLLEQAGDARARAWLHGDLGYKALEHGAFDEARHHIERSMGLALKLDDQVHYTFDVEHLALWALETGDHVGSAAGLSEALARYFHYGIRRPICEALVALATIAAHAGEPARAAKLLGAAMTLRAEEPLTRVEERLHSQAMQLLRHSDTTASWERSYAAGCRCGLEEAVALGLETASRYGVPPLDRPSPRFAHG